MKTTRGVWMLMAGLLAGAGVTAAAAEAEDASPRMRAAIELFHTARMPEALAAFEGIVAAEPDNATAWFHLGWLEFKRGEPEGAVKLLENAVTLDPTRSRYFHILGDAYGRSAKRASFFSKAGLAKKCIAAYDRAVTANPDDLEVRVARYHYYREAPAFIGGGMDKARGEAEEIRQRDPIRGTPLVIQLLVKEKKTDDAFALIERLVQENPDNAAYLYQLGKLAATTGQRLERGEATLERCMNAAPGAGSPPRSSVQVCLGQIREKRGDKTAARAAFATALELDPGSKEARAGLQQVER